MKEDKSAMFVDIYKYAKQRLGICRACVRYCCLDCCLDCCLISASPTCRVPCSAYAHGSSRVENFSFYPGPAFYPSQAFFYPGRAGTLTSGPGYPYENFILPTSGVSATRRTCKISALSFPHIIYFSHSAFRVATRSNAQHRPAYARLLISTFW